MEDSCTIQQFTKSSSHLRLTNTGEIICLFKEYKLREGTLIIEKACLLSHDQSRYELGKH